MAAAQRDHDAVLEKELARGKELEAASEAVQKERDALQEARKRAEEGRAEAEARLAQLEGEQAALQSQLKEAIQSGGMPSMDHSLHTSSDSACAWQAHEQNRALQQQHEADIAEHKGLLDASFVDAEAM